MAQQDDRHRQWFKALGSVVTVAAIIGTVFGTATYGAVHLTGLAAPEPSTAQQQPSSRPRASAERAAARPDPVSARAAVEERSPAARPVGEAGRGEVDRTNRAARVVKARRGHERRGAHRPPGRSRHHPRQRTRDRLTIRADRHHVGRMGRINLSGRYRGHAGTILVVQRMEHGRWERFPVSVAVRGGRFRTWVASGRPGPNRFRVRDPRTHRRSAPVTVIIR